MTDRRRDGTAYQSGSVGYNRVMARIDEGMAGITERLEAHWDRVDKRMARMEQDIASGADGSSKLSTDLAELRRDLGDLRDTVTLANKGETEAAAKGAAAGATEAAGAVAAKVVAQTMPQPRTRLEKLIAWAVAFTTIMVAANNVPDAARAIDKIWLALRNDHSTAAAPKKDETSGE